MTKDKLIQILKQHVADFTRSASYPRLKAEIGSETHVDLGEWTKESQSEFAQVETTVTDHWVEEGQGVIYVQMTVYSERTTLGAAIYVLEDGSVDTSHPMCEFVNGVPQAIS